MISAEEENVEFFKRFFKNERKLIRIERKYNRPLPLIDPRFLVCT